MKTFAISDFSLFSFVVVSMRSEGHLHHLLLPRPRPVAMDVLLSALRPAIQGRTALCDSRYRGGITADGYVPGAGGNGRLSARQDRRQSGQLQRNDGAEGSPASLGLTLANLGLQFAGIATVLYMSARMTQYMLQLKERETQQAARSLLRAKLPARRDIDMDSLNLNAHEISVAMVRGCSSLSYCTHQ